MSSGASGGVVVTVSIDIEALQVSPRGQVSRSLTRTSPLAQHPPETRVAVSLIVGDSSTACAEVGVG